MFPGKAKLRNLQHALHLELFDYKSTIVLSDSAIMELKCWRIALQYMNGVPLTWVFSSPSYYHDEVWTDAALKGDLKDGGMGGCSKSGMAYQIDNRQTIAYAISLCREGVDIKLMEMVALFVMFIYFAPQWNCKNVKFYCDNGTVVSSLAKKRGPLGRRDLHFIVDKMCQISAQYHFRFWIEKVDGKHNVMADRLSRFKQLYSVDQMDPTDFEYVPTKAVVKIVNNVLAELLDFKRVPHND